MKSRPILCLLVLATGGGPVADELRWKNGDVMPGVLLGGGADRIRWSSPHWPEPWVLQTGSLESVRFDSTPDASGGTWRILTFAGDVLLADPEGADDLFLHIDGPIPGARRIRRDAVRMMERVDVPDRIFLADSYRDWLDRGSGPILDLRYRVYALGAGWDREGEIPDFSRMEPIDEGKLPEGRIDFGVVRFDGPRAVVFEGEIELLDSDHTMNMSAFYSEGGVANWGRLTVGSHELEIDHRKDRDPGSYTRRSSFHDTPGRRDLRFEYIGDAAEHPICPGLLPEGVGGPFFGLGVPRSLLAAGAVPRPEWKADSDGELTTERFATLVRPMVVPESFEIELELSSSRSPRFRFGLGPTLSAGSSVDAFRLETWGEALVVTRGDFFETVRILEEGEREVRLRLHYDGSERRLMVLALDGTLLARWEGERIDPGDSGICLVNRGDDLTVERICLTRLCSGAESSGFARDRVHLVGGGTLPGSLRRDAATGAWSVLSGEESRDLELDRVVRVVHAARERDPVPADAVLIYGRGEILKGRLLEVGQETVTLATGLDVEPMICSREGLVSLQFFSSDHRKRFQDSILRTDEFTLQGKLVLQAGEEPLWWLPEGAREPQPLASRITGRVERLRTASIGSNPPHRIWFHGNMSVPCRLISCDADLVEIETPLLGRCTLASRYIRAIELDRRPVRLVPEREAFRWLEEWLERIPPENIMGNGTPTPVVVPDDEVVERIKEALIIPRIRQDPPPTHLLVARNGDVRRGNLVSIDENSVRLRVRQREQVLARDLLR